MGSGRHSAILRRDPTVPRMREICSLLLLCFGLLPTIYNNILDPVLQVRPCDSRADNPIKSAPCWVLRQGQEVGLGTMWRLYSPTWKFTIWIDWVRVDAAGNESPLNTVGLSPEYRDRRGTLDATFFDTKYAIVQSRFFTWPQIRDSFGKYLCKTSRTQPARIRAYASRVTIPPDFGRGEEFRKIPPTRSVLGEWSCDGKR